MIGILAVWVSTTLVVTLMMFSEGTLRFEGGECSPNIVSLSDNLSISENPQFGDGNVVSQYFKKLSPFAFSSDFVHSLPPHDLSSAANTNKKVRESMLTPELKALRAKHGDSSSVYYSLPQELYDDVLRFFPPSLLELETPRIEWQVIECEDILVPHSDVDRLSVVNIYVSVHGEETVFYLKNYTDFYIIPEMNDQMVFSVDWLTPANVSFTAQANDIYAIDVTQIHSVNSCKKGHRRIAVSCGFYLNYQTLMSHLR